MNFLLLIITLVLVVIHVMVVHDDAMMRGWPSGADA